MSLNILDIVKSYRDGRPLTKAMLDTIFDAIQTWATLELRNRQQIMRDSFSFGYTTDNDGNANLTKSLQDERYFPNKSILHYDFNDTAGNLSATIFNNIWWAATLTNATATITNSLNGNLRLATTSAGVASAVAAYRFAGFDPLNNPSFECVINVSAVTSMAMKVGWRSIATPTDDYAYFKVDSALSSGGILLCSRNNGGTEVVTEPASSVEAAVSIKLRVKLEGISLIRFYVNDVEIGQEHTGSIDYLTDFVPFFQLENKVNEVRTMDIDYARTVQDRSV